VGKLRTEDGELTTAFRNKKVLETKRFWKQKGFGNKKVLETKRFWKQKVLETKSFRN
jgi:hypothetical protein